ncbi:hypothetical protein HYW59_01810 [Candidatus Kaiserbacteria bacterium]|nr:hypothetical protein [Candidatus Kaiserbacteria bacterium]
MFCWRPVFNQAPSSRRAVTVPCPSAFGTTGFDTPDGLLHIGDYYFQASTNKYVAYVGAGITATSTPAAPKCVSPHYVESSTKPTGMREVHQIENSYYQSCMLDEQEIAVRISAEEYAALATAHGIPPLKIDPSQQVNCIYTSQVQNPSPRRR